MSADSPKERLASPVDSCALYYFPEIPCRTGPLDAPTGVAECFVGGSADPIHNHSAPPAPSPDGAMERQRNDDAFAKGLEQGRSEMRACQQDRIDQAVGALQTAMQEMARIRQHDIEQMEIETVRLALAIVGKIIGHASEHASVIRHVVQAAMRKVADPRRMTVRLNPRDVETVDAFKPELLPTDDVGAHLRLEADESIQRGGCVIETQLGEVDARIDQQLKTMERLLSAQLPRTRAES